MRLHARAGVLSHVTNEHPYKTSALLAWDCTISVAFECLAGKKFHSEREKDDACAKLLFKGCRRLAVGYRWRRKIVDDRRKNVGTRAVHCERGTTSSQGRQDYHAFIVVP